MRTYTFNECYELLHVDPKTFRGWLKEAGIDPDHQVSRSDRRIRFLTHEQLSKLAEDHGRLLGGSVEDGEEAISPGAFKLLLDRVARVEEEIAHHQPRLLEATHHLEDLLAESQEEFKESRITVNKQITDLVLAQTNQYQALKEDLQALDRKVDQVVETLTERLNQIGAEQQADLDTTLRLQEQLDTHRTEQAATLGTFETSLGGIQALQDGLQLQISALEKDLARDIADLTSRVEKESQGIWLKLMELTSSNEGRKEIIATIQQRTADQEHRLTELFNLVQEGRSEARTDTLAQKKVPSRRKQTQQRASSGEQ